MDGATDGSTDGSADAAPRPASVIAMTATTSTASRTTAPGASAPTGEQWTIEHGPWTATVVEVGGGLRTLTRDGLDLVAARAEGGEEGIVDVFQRRQAVSERAVKIQK